MRQLIEEIYQIIHDYRQDEGLMSVERITDWINQFDENDRHFVLEEMKNILQKRYISKGKAISLVKQMIEFLADRFEYKTPREFLLDSLFIDHQPMGKSQKVLLSFLDEIIQDEYSVSLAQCNSDSPKYYIYFDDILCTGDTFVKGLTKNDGRTKGWFYQIRPDGKTNFDKFKEDGGKLVLAYFAIHKKALEKLKGRLYFGLGKFGIGFQYAWDDDYLIENNIDDISSKLDFVFPKESVKDKLVEDCQKQIEEKVKSAGYHDGMVIEFRKDSRPIDEKFFSSVENRDRFERIILSKCIELYNSSQSLTDNPRPRPLGYGLYTDLSFGFGTLIFTWRNVPFNVPLVFWYKSKNWISLFERKFIEYEH